MVLYFYPYIFNAVFNTVHTHIKKPYVTSIYLIPPGVIDPNSEKQVIKNLSKFIKLPYHKTPK